MNEYLHLFLLNLVVLARVIGLFLNVRKLIKSVHVVFISIVAGIEVGVRQSWWLQKLLAILSDFAGM